MESTNEHVSTDEIVTKRLVTNLLYLTQLKDCAILLSGECYIGSNWKKDDTTLLYMVMYAVTKTIRTVGNPYSLTLIMYDGIKPFSDENKGNNLTSYAYKAYMQNANRIIYNSNTTEFGEFMDNAIPLKAPRIHFPRYGYSVDKIDRKRLNTKSLRIACITVVLSEFREPSQGDAVTSYVEQICRSGIHFHYFCNQNSRQ